MKNHKRTDAQGSLRRRTVTSIQRNNSSYFKGVSQINTRWRQISKLISDKYDRWEYICENEVNDNKCPCCGAKIREQSWSEDLGCVETDRRCRDCNYLRNWSYGYTSLQVGEWDGEYPHSTPDYQVEEIEAEFSRQIAKESVRRKEQIRKYYRRLARRGS